VSFFFEEDGFRWKAGYIEKKQTPHFYSLGVLFSNKGVGGPKPGAFSNSIPKKGIFAVVNLKKKDLLFLFF